MKSFAMLDDNATISNLHRKAPNILMSSTFVLKFSKNLMTLPLKYVYSKEQKKVIRNITKTFKKNPAK